jgi:hypothetical protein
LRAIAADAEMPPFSLHSIRKTAASLLRDASGRREEDRGRRDPCARDAEMDTASFKVDLETMRDALSVIDEEWERYNRRSEGKVVEVVELAARRA